MRIPCQVRLAGGESSRGILAACILSGAPFKTQRRGAHLLDSINTIWCTEASRFSATTKTMMGPFWQQSTQSSSHVYPFYLTCADLIENLCQAHRQHDSQRRASHMGSMISKRAERAESSQSFTSEQTSGEDSCNSTPCSLRFHGLMRILNSECSSRSGRLWLHSMEPFSNISLVYHFLRVCALAVLIQLIRSLFQLTYAQKCLLPHPATLTRK